MHPDRHLNAGASDRRQAIAKAMDVNEAFRTLKDPIRRGEALVRLAAGAAGAAPAPEPAADMELLMSVMELRGALGVARAARDLVAIRDATSQVQALAATVTGEASRALAAVVAAPDPAGLALATKALGKLRYYRRFLDEAQAIADDLADAAGESAP